MPESPQAQFETAAMASVATLSAALPAFRLAFHFPGDEGYLELDEPGVEDLSDRDGYAAWQAVATPLDGADPVAITTFLDGTVEVAEYAVRWDGQIPSPARSIEHRSFLPPVQQGLLEGTPDAPDRRALALAHLVQSKDAKRRARYFTCEYCGNATNPEGGSASTICHGCMSTHQGVVF